MGLSGRLIMGLFLLSRIESIPMQPASFSILRPHHHEVKRFSCESQEGYAAPWRAMGFPSEDIREP
jgi:hypothetical protein